MSQCNSAAEGDLHSFHSPWTPMTRSRAEATGSNMQLPGDGEALNRCIWKWGLLALHSGSWQVG